MKKILILGGTGFIGRNLVEYFLKRPEFDVSATHFRREPHNSSVNWFQIDLRIEKSVKELFLSNKFDIVIQAAATTSGSKDIIETPHIHVTDNAVMNSLIFREASLAKVKHFVFFSCTVMYKSSDRPLKESCFDANQAINPKYFGVGWTKVYLEKMCEFYASISSTKYTSIRHSNIYGPHDKFDLERSHVLGATITKVLETKNGKVVVWGDGSEARDFLYVDDLLSLVNKLVSNQIKPFELVNCGSGKALPIRDLVSTIIRVSGRDLRIEFDVTKPSIKTSLCLDCSYATQNYGWSPSVDIEEGIKKTLQWYRRAS